MIIYLHEYNVVPDMDKKDELILKVEDNKIIYNNLIIENMEKVNEMNKLLLSYKDTLLHLKDIKYSNSKGGRQKQLSIHCDSICCEKIVLLGNTNNEEIANFYSEFKNKVISLLEK